MIKRDGQGIIQATGKGECGREKAINGGVMFAKERIKRALSITGSAPGGLVVRAIEVTCQPRRSNASDNSALAMPPPMIAVSRFSLPLR